MDRDISLKRALRAFVAPVRVALYSGKQQHLEEMMGVLDWPITEELAIFGWQSDRHNLPARVHCFLSLRKLNILNSDVFSLFQGIDAPMLDAVELGQHPPHYKAGVPSNLHGVINPQRVFESARNLIILFGLSEHSFHRLSYFPLLSHLRLKLMSSDPMSIIRFMQWQNRDEVQGDASPIYSTLSSKLPSLHTLHMEVTLPEWEITTTVDFDAAFIPNIKTLIQFRADHNLPLEVVTFKCTCHQIYKEILPEIDQ